MRARALALTPLAALAAVLSLLPRPSFACSICGCDPAASTLGVERPSTQAVRLSLENRYLAKESGDGPEAESEREMRLVLRAQYSPWTPLVLQLDVPLFLWKSHLNAFGLNDDTGRGLGDVALGARYELFRLGGMEPRHVLAVTSQLKLPTGANDRHLPSADPDEHLQLGSGSFDGVFGLSYIFGARPWALFAQASARVNGTNARGFHYGNALFASLGARRNVLEGEKLLLSLEAQARSAGMDRFADGSRDESSGGQVYYATGSAAYALTESLLLRALVQVPVATSLNGAQSEHPVAYLQFAYDFAL
jgi:hypothetical protein